MKNELLLVFDEDQALPHRNARWAPFDDEAIPSSPMVRGVHTSRVTGGRIHRCPCGFFHEVRFDDKGATVASWEQALPEPNASAPESGP